jgi:hypothetical protein
VRLRQANASRPASDRVALCRLVRAKLASARCDVNELQSGQSSAGSRLRQWPSSGRTAQVTTCALIACLLSTGCRAGQGAAHASARSHEGATRYRLLLRDNPVNAGDAFRCYGSCQESRTPSDYVDCLSKCPGFEVTPDEYCSHTEVPPVAACLTVRKLPKREKVDPGLVVLAVVGSFLLVVSAGALCSSSRSQCGTYPPPGYAPGSPPPF